MTFIPWVRCMCKSGNTEHWLKRLRLLVTFTGVDERVDSELSNLKPQDVYLAMFALVGVRGSISSKTVNKNVSQLTWVKAGMPWNAHGSRMFKFTLLIFRRPHGYCSPRLIIHSRAHFLAYMVM